MWHKDKILKNKNFYKSLVVLVIPIAIQNLISNAVNSVDIFMLGYVGQAELSAVSLANQYLFILQGFFFGINSGITILAAQYWGRQDTKSIQAVMGIALKITMFFTFVLSVLAITCPRLMMQLYTDEKELIYIGEKYLKVIGISYFLMGFSQVYHSILRSVERAGTSTAITFISLMINVFLNAVSIFGLFGFPKMGVIGVAYATVIARVFELLMCLCDLLRGRVFKADLKIIFKRHRLLLKDFFKYSIPALANDISWTLAFSSYSVILGHMGSDVVAASSVTTTIRNLFTVVCFGIGSAGTVLIGKRIGERNMEQAKEDASSLCHISLASGMFTAVLIVAFSPLFSSFFSLSDTAMNYLNGMLLISSYYIIGQIINTVLIAGVFRAGGNTKFGLVCDTVTMWVISVPLGFISAFVLKLPPLAVYFVLCLDEFWKIPVVYKYYKSYRWLKNITREYE